jgi:hypothetical protein
VRIANSSMKLAVCLAVAALPASACGSRAVQVVGVATYPWPEGPGPVAAGKTANPSAEMISLDLITPAIPANLPAPLRQPAHPRLSRDCPQGGAIVEVALSDGRTISYGPCRRPAAIERLGLAMYAAANFLSRSIGNTPAATLHWLIDLVWKTAFLLRDPNPYDVVIRLGGKVDRVSMRGNFTCAWCTRSPGAPARSGNLAAFTADAKGRGIISFSLRPY